MALDVADRVKVAAVSLRRMPHHLLREQRLRERGDSIAVAAFLLACGSAELSLRVHVDGFAGSGFPESG